MDYKEEYEKCKRKYEAALKTAKDLLSQTNFSWCDDDVRCIFPELRESEDEKIRKELLDAFKESEDSIYLTLTPYKRERYIAWFEKQGEQKSADKVEPKFKVGDWITDGEKVWKIGYIEDGMYIEHHGTISGGGTIESIDKHYHLWTIQDAKDGDVLVYPDGTIVIFKYRLDGLNSGIYMSHILLSTKIEISQSCAVSKDITPATKEQRDLLFAKMKEAGYEWNAEKKELKKIEQKPTEWGDEDEMCKNYIESVLYYDKSLPTDIRIKLSDWLKLIKDRILPQPQQEWSEEDKSFIEDITNVIIENYNILQSDKEKMIDWLKSIKPNHWKPSEEQLMGMETAINILTDKKFHIAANHLKSIYNRIKSL